MLTLAEFFELQNTFNKRVGLDDKYFAEKLAGPNNTPFDVGVLLAAGQWIDDMLKAMSSEMEELRDCTYWKHWCSEAQSGQRYRVKDVGAARKEVIDLLHFWISLAQILGMSPDMVSDMYEAKLAKNLKRQDDGYSIEIKDLAWQLRIKHPQQCPVPYPTAAKSLEELPEEAAQFYLDWAKRGVEGESIVTDCTDAGKLCMYCVEKNCRVRKYLSTLENQDESCSYPGLRDTRGGCKQCRRKNCSDSRRIKDES